MITVFPAPEKIQQHVCSSLYIPVYFSDYQRHTKFKLLHCVWGVIWQEWEENRVWGKQCRVSNQRLVSGKELPNRGKELSTFTCTFCPQRFFYQVRFFSPVLLSTYCNSIWVYIVNLIYYPFVTALLTYKCRPNYNPILPSWPLELLHNFSLTTYLHNPVLFESDSIGSL